MMRVETSTAGEADRAAREEVHEFLLLGFAEGIAPGAQVLVMEALDLHFSRCQGLVSREYFRDVEGRWVKHLVWRSQADLEASADLEEDPVVAELFACFDTQDVGYAVCRRFEPQAWGRSADATAPV